MVNFFYLFSVPINKHFFFIHRCSILGFLTYIHYINNNAGSLDDVKVSKNIFFPFYLSTRKAANISLSVHHATDFSIEIASLDLLKV